MGTIFLSQAQFMLSSGLDPGALESDLGVWVQPICLVAM